MTDPMLTYPAQYTPPPPKSRTGLYIAVAAIAVFVLVGAAVVVTLLATRDSGSGAKSPAAGKTFNVSGTLTLTLGAYMNEDDVNCHGLEGYDDIEPGVQVEVYDATGKAVGLGALGNGQIAGPDRQILDTTVHGDRCMFMFSVTRVPSGAGPYAVEISHRGKIAFNELGAGSLALTLGD